ncbi:MAG: GNAT family N-acetyltransferase [Candidatus Zambryskibacteria bacterium]|nr:GNAT family N-acetyltransferase [Candidatus Zambryskibacteria bacterium]
MRIRKKNFKDILTIAKITKHSFPMFFKRIPFLFFPGIVTEIDNLIIGFLIENGDEIVLIATDRNYRNKNVGTELLKRSKSNWAKVRKDNKVAINFYIKNGFEIVKIKNRKFFGDVVIVKR